VISSWDDFRRRLAANRLGRIFAWVLVVAGIVGVALALIVGSAVNLVIQVLVILVGLGYLALIYADHR
jgi:hypothetical protein